MKKHKGISLIETLISLTIVSVSVMALIPSVTVKNKGENYTHSNSLWELNDANNPTHIKLKNQNGNTPSISLGQNPVERDCNGTNDNNCIFTHLFPLYSSTADFRNRNIPALGVTGQLNIRGTQLEANQTRLHIYSGTPTTTANSATYPMSIFTDNSTAGADTRDIVAISNVAATDNTIARRNLSFDYDAGNNATNFAPRYFATAANNNATADLNSFYSLTTGNTEEQLYTYFAANTGANGDLGGINAFSLVGIGKNAAKYFNNNIHNGVVIVNDIANVPNNAYTFGNDENGVSANGIAIGHRPNAQYSFDNPASGDFVIHKTGNGPFYINAANVNLSTVTAISFYLSSDKRLKNIIGKYTRGLDEILKIKPVEFTYKADKEQKHHIGVIAQDIKKHIPEAVKVNKETHYYMVDDDPVFYAVLNAIKGLNEKNKQIERNNRELEGKIAELKVIRDKMKASRGGANVK